MGTISERQTTSGTTRYRAVIRINKGGIKYSESRTFSKRNLAESWLKKREAQIELNPDVIHQSEQKDDMRFSDAISLYLEQAGADFGRSHKMGLLFIAKLAIGAKYITKLTNADFANFAEFRLQTVKPQTLTGDMIAIRAVLRYAKMVWGMNVNLSGFEEVMLGLRYARKVKGSDKRSRLPSNDELQLLTNHFYEVWQRGIQVYPMHLIMWFAIYTSRREGEIVNLLQDDLTKTEDGHWWLVRDMKNPKGSKGNHIEVKIPEKTIPIVNAFKDTAIRQRMQKSPYYDDEKLIPLDSKTISKSFTDACKILGIDDLKFHDLRHEAATRLAEQGLTIPQIQQVTGHRSWGSLQRYTNLKRRPAVLDFKDAIEQAKQNHDRGRGSF